jgi:cellulose synthase/poly-beta-1,6-N-acetylglucosamine synthase-like glycosyltransferase
MTWTIVEWAFWGSVAALAYSYVLYPVLLFLLAAVVQTARDLSFVLRRRNRRPPVPADPPRVSVLLAAYNEQDVIEAKLRNCRALEYPADRLEVLVGLDAPGDATAQRARPFAGGCMQVFEFPERRGKMAVMADLAARSSGEILVSTDANTFLDPAAIHNLARHFADPAVGAVCSEIRVTDPGGKLQNESLYWRYEVMLKFLENRLNCTLGGTGGLYAIRRSLFAPVDAITEDFQMVMQVRWAGHRVVYDPEGLATEEAAPTPADEFRRKTRIGAGNFQTLVGRPEFLNPFKGLPFLAYFSHKVLRWLGPLFLIAALVTCAWLALESPLYRVLLAAQLAFYALALLGYLRHSSRGSAGVFAPVFYFASMNVALLFGLFRFLSGRQQAVWSATPRSVPLGEAEGRKSA